MLDIVICGQRIKRSPSWRQSRARDLFVALRPYDDLNLTEAFSVTSLPTLRYLQSSASLLRSMVRARGLGSLSRSSDADSLHAGTLPSAPPRRIAWLVGQP